VTKGEGCVCYTHSDSFFTACIDSAPTRWESTLAVHARDTRQRPAARGALRAVVEGIGGSGRVEIAQLIGPLDPVKRGRHGHDPQLGNCQ
jgi:hypothetical protein